MTNVSLPPARGPRSAALFGHLSGAHVPRTVEGPEASGLLGADVLADEDAQLTLHCIYELSYRGLPGVHAGFECDPWVLSLRREIEWAMEVQLRDEVGPLPHDAPELLRQVAAASGGPSLSAELVEHPDAEHLREFLVHRSIYQLKEADPHSWALPRLAGRAKAALVEIQFDEYGRGEPGRSHAELFATTMRSMGLDDTYGRYLAAVPAVTLATGNLIGLFGLQRRLLPALIGHLALFEMTSVGPMSRYSAALEAIGVGAEGREFFDVHVVADAHHEQLALDELVGGLLADEPGAAPEVCFGALALTRVEAAFSGHLLDSFRSGRSSLRDGAATVAR